MSTGCSSRGSIPSTYMMAHNHSCDSSSGESNLICMYICRQDTHTHRINVFFKNGMLVPMTSEAHWMLVGLICALLLNWSYGHFRVRSVHGFIHPYRAFLLFPYRYSKHDLIFYPIAVSCSVSLSLEFSADCYQVLEYLYVK